MGFVLGCTCAAGFPEPEPFPPPPEERGLFDFPDWAEVETDPAPDVVPGFMAIAEDPDMMLLAPLTGLQRVLPDEPALDMFIPAPVVPPPAAVLVYPDWADVETDEMFDRIPGFLEVTEDET